MKNIILILVIASSVIACNNKPEKSTANYTMDVNVAMPEISTVTLQKSYPGSIKAQNEVNLVARVNGFLQEVNYKPGDMVKKGQLLFVIEPKPYKEALAQAEAKLSSAESQNEYAQINYESMKEAARTNAVSQIDFIQAETNWSQAIAAVKAAKASVENAKTDLDYCYIRAPFNGHISKKTVDTGNYLNGSASPQVLATIYDDRSVLVTFSIEDSQYMRMISQQKDTQQKHKYDTINLSFNESLPHIYTGIINYLSPMVDISTGTVTLQAIVDNKYGELKSGMYCVVHLPYSEMDKAILIKDAAISTDQLGKFIYTVNDSNQVVYTPITISDAINDTLRIVTSGLSPNQKYITQARQKVRDGRKVNPVLTK